MKSEQQAFLEHIGMLIPKLFDAIRLGNVKSEYVLGDRIIGQRQVRLKLVAEVVDPGSNPLATHSQMREAHSEPPSSKQPHPNMAYPDAKSGYAAKQDVPLSPRRGPRRKHPLSGT